MFERPGVPRAGAGGLHDALQALSHDDFDSRCAARDRRFRDQGITFSLSGEERPFPLDLIPRVIQWSEWQTIEAGVVQRVRALEMFLADVYGEGVSLKDRVIPRRLVASSKHFHRTAYGIDPPNRVRVQVAGIDVVRGHDGRFRVLEDNLRTPSGISYVIENRRMMARLFPELFAVHRVLPVDHYPARLLAALRAASPRQHGDPVVVLLTPGVYNAAYFEHAFLAQQMGVPLVEGRDLVCRDNVVYMRTTERERRVDVVYRRVDDDFLDPVHFRGDSLVGCPGIVNAAREGNVAIANAVGNGVADDKLMGTYVPDLIRYFLGEEPLLPNVETYRPEDPDQLAYVIGRLDTLVIKPVDGSGGYGLVMGPHATDAELAAACDALVANPRQFIVQEVVALSTAPTHVGDRVAPRHVDLRPFAINDGQDIWVVPGGLTRVALTDSSLIVNSSQGGGSKDTWVLAPQSGDDDGGRLLARSVATISGTIPAGAQLDLGPMPHPNNEQQQQQQQQARSC
ncbi:MAG: circularly permuted type 2 ATP-grasp protein [Actinobacteria bacterium]|nr:circularly permuted type 2 ATP-grasp protein [Actinomycetota bacterium]